METQKVPFFSLQRQWNNHSDELTNAQLAVAQSQQFVGGEFLATFEKKLRDFVGVNHVVGCNSGTDALWMALDVLKIASNTIVLTTPFSFIASSSEIVAHGGVPVFVDIDPVSYNICPHKLRTWLEKNTLVLHNKTIHRETGHHVAGMIVVDLFGQLADYVELKKIAAEWNLWIIEDACQAIGAHENQVQAGAHGDIGTFSFYPTKNLGAMGDAGALTTNNPWLAERLLKLRNHGRKNHYEYEEYGINSRLDGMQAAALSAKLPYLENYNFARRTHAAQYRTRLSGIPHIRLPQEIIGFHTYHQFSLTLVDDATPAARNTLMQKLAERGIDTRVFYPEPLHKIPFLSTHPQLVSHCPEAERAARSIISLPIWPELTKNEIDFVCDGIIRALDDMYGQHTKASQQQTPSILT